MALRLQSSKFDTISLANNTATGTVTFTQTGNSGGVKFVLQSSNIGSGGWTTVARTGINDSPIDGTNQAVSFSGVTLPPNDGGLYFRIGAQRTDESGANVGGVRGRNAIVSGNTTVCFLAGTRIATPDGEAAVETLAIGDLVLTADGRAVPVMWLGRQRVSTYFALAEARRPVLIRAGALGEALPVRDLRVTADHAMLIDGVLVQAGALVNGRSIARMTLADLGDTFTVFHIETAGHEIVLAEGAATETFVDNVTRARFDNFAEFIALYGNEDRPMAELDQPRAMSARQVPAALRARIAALAGAEAAVA